MSPACAGDFLDTGDRCLGYADGYFRGPSFVTPTSDGFSPRCSRIDAVCSESNPLLARRVPRDQVIPGRAYVVHARNGGVGVAVIEDGILGYRVHRVKFDRHFLDTETDWLDSEIHGTAIPLRLLPDVPPGDADLLAWLADRESECRDEVDAAWREVETARRA